MVAMDTSDELHVTEVVMSCVVLSEKVPVAVNCCVDPSTISGLEGETVIESSVGVGAGVSSPPPQPQPAIKTAISNTRNHILN
jgi:hypothetical protein